MRRRRGGPSGGNKRLIISHPGPRGVSGVEFIKISAAKNMRSGVNVLAEVKTKGEKRNVNLKTGGNVDVCDAVIMDETGEMKLTLWAEDIDKVKSGDKIAITNGYINAFRGEPSITKGKFGKMEINPS